MSGVDTGEYANGKELKGIGGLFFVTGNRTYETTAGGTNTVYVFQHMNPEPFVEQWLKDNRLPVLDHDEPVNLEDVANDSAERRNRRAASLLHFAKKFIEDGKPTHARKRLEEIVETLWDTDSAKEAKTLLSELD